MVLSEVVDETIAAKIGDLAINILSQFGNQLKLGEMEVGPGQVTFFAINIGENEHLSYNTDVHVKLNAFLIFIPQKVR